MANTLTFNQLATVLNSIVSQATGTESITPTNTSEFVSVANTALLTGYDPLNTAISQVLSKTIFSIRPYYRKFASMMVDGVRYGNHVRKLQAVDKAWEEDDRFKLEDGKSIDQQKVNKPTVLQTNFYGSNVFQKSLTVFKDQLDCAFNSVDEFGRFVAMIMTNATDQIEQAHEGVVRATLANLIGGVYTTNNAAQVVHLLTSYNTETGSSLTTTSVMAGENFTSFMRWAYSKISTISDMLTERSTLYHTNVSGKVISRHTPKRDQRMYLSAKYLKAMDSVVLSQTYNPDYLNIGEYEAVNYWQSITDPGTINVTPSYLKPDGSVGVATEALELSNVFGVLMDVEAAGVTTVNQWSATAPMNARGGYTNYFWHFTDRYWNDFTENVVVFMLD